MGWSKPAQARARDIEKSFNSNLRQIADCFATHERAAAVSEPHVEKAFVALANCGCTRRRWIDRPDSETAVGGLCFGLAFAMPDVVGSFYDGDTGKPFAAGILIAMVVVGTFLFAHGTYRARLPQATSGVGPVRGSWRYLVELALMAMAIIGVGYLLYALVADLRGAGAAREPPSATSSDRE